MLKNVPLTAYDVFAIFLPGAIILISVIVIYYSFFPPEIPIDLSHYSYMEWLIVIVSCYFSGFVAQASARHLDKITAKIWSWGHAFTISDRGYDVEQSNKIFELARKKAAHVVGIDLENIDEWSLVNIIHEILSQKGEIQGVDYLLSRELFFRGMAAAPVFSFIGFLLRYFSGKPIFEPTVALPNWIFLVTAIVSVLGVRRAMVSHRHMAKMRVRKLVIGFLAVHLSADAASQADASA